MFEWMKEEAQESVVFGDPNSKRDMRPTEKMTVSRGPLFPVSL